MSLEELQNCEDNDVRLFTMTYPHIAEKVVKWFKEDSVYIFELNDGRFVEYDWLDNTHRYIMNPEEKQNRDDIEWRKEFSYKLKKRMARMRMTQIELSRRCGISTRIILRYTQGISIPSAYNLEKIAYALKCDIKDLI